MTNEELIAAGRMDKATGAAEYAERAGMYARKAVEAERVELIERAAAIAEAKVKFQGHCAACDIALLIAADIRGLAAL